MCDLWSPLHYVIKLPFFYSCGLRVHCHSIRYTIICYEWPPFPLLTVFFATFTCLSPAPCMRSCAADGLPREVWPRRMQQTGQPVVVLLYVTIKTSRDSRDSRPLLDDVILRLRRSRKRSSGTAWRREYSQLVDSRLLFSRARLRLLKERRFPTLSCRPVPPWRARRRDRALNDVLNQSVPDLFEAAVSPASTLVAVGDALTSPAHPPSVRPRGCQPKVTVANSSRPFRSRRLASIGTRSPSDDVQKRATSPADPLSVRPRGGGRRCKQFQTVPKPPSRQQRHLSPSDDVQRRATSPADPPSVHPRDRGRRCKQFRCRSSPSLAPMPLRSVWHCLYVSSSFCHTSFFFTLPSPTVSLYP